MNETLDNWFYQNRNLLDDYNHLVWENNILKSKLEIFENKMTIKKSIKKILYIFKIRK